jgi:hypothetical protein
MQQGRNQQNKPETETPHTHPRQYSLYTRTCGLSSGKVGSDQEKRIKTPGKLLFHIVGVFSNNPAAFPAVVSCGTFLRTYNLSTELMHPNVRIGCKQISVRWQTAEVSS